MVAATENPDLAELVSDPSLPIAMLRAVLSVDSHFCMVRLWTARRRQLTQAVRPTADVASNS